MSTNAVSPLSQPLAQGPVEVALRAGRARIARYGVTQRVYGDYSQGYCTLGALGYACDVLPDAEIGVLDDAENILLRVTGSACLHQWNDHPLRTESDVLEAYDAAIEIAVKENR